jgi:hypothetical protein
MIPRAAFCWDIETLGGPQPHAVNLKHPLRPLDAQECDDALFTWVIGTGRDQPDTYMSSNPAQPYCDLEPQNCACHRAEMAPNGISDGETHKDFKKAISRQYQHPVDC